MKLENQVCSLELSRKLDKLGIKQKSVWYWVGNREDKMFLSQETRDFRESYPYEFIYSAFIVSELGEELKKYPNEAFSIKNIPEELETTNENVMNKIFNAGYWAKMLIYLKENKLT